MTPSKTYLLYQRVAGMGCFQSRTNLAERVEGHCQLSGSEVQLSAQGLDIHWWQNILLAEVQT